MKISGRKHYTLILLDLTIAVWLLCLFHLIGNSTDVASFGRSVLYWMITRWRDSTFYAADYSHGWLIPLVSLMALWRSRNALKNAQKATWPLALAVVCIALLMHLAGLRAQIPRLSLFSLMLLLWSIPAFLYGKQVAKITSFPVFYLFFCIPLNFLDSISFPLRMFATKLSVLLLNGINIPTISQGTAILSQTGTFALDIADPCSGIKSLLALTAITVALSYFIQTKTWCRATLIAMSIPTAVAGNVARIIALAIFATFFGQDKAFTFYHDYSGYIVFIVAVGLMLAADKAINRIETLLNTSRDKISS